ncbi:hypothetical protein F5Y13DRAFT_157074 [Hypoxylon sp. FL1857]|nr:hypothetical protein F5Y13DRAFT_157074 [Hypoxylon sp. FL1857]
MIQHRKFLPNHYIRERHNKGVVYSFSTHSHAVGNSIEWDADRVNDNTHFDLPDPNILKALRIHGDAKGGFGAMPEVLEKHLINTRLGWLLQPPECTVKLPILGTSVPERYVGQEGVRHAAKHEHHH